MGCGNKDTEAYRNTVMTNTESSEDRLKGVKVVWLNEWAIYCGWGSNEMCT